MAIRCKKLKINKRSFWLVVLIAAIGWEVLGSHGAFQPGDSGPVFDVDYGRRESALKAAIERGDRAALLEIVNNEFQLGLRDDALAALGVSLPGEVRLILAILERENRPWPFETTYEETLSRAEFKRHLILSIAPALNLRVYPDLLKRVHLEIPNVLSESAVSEIIDQANAALATRGSSQSADRSSRGRAMGPPVAVDDTKTRRLDEERPVPAAEDAPSLILSVIGTLIVVCVLLIIVRARKASPHY